MNEGYLKEEIVTSRGAIVLYCLGGAFCGALGTVAFILTGIVTIAV